MKAMLSVDITVREREELCGPAEDTLADGNKNLFPRIF